VLRDPTQYSVENPTTRPRVLKVGGVVPFTAADFPGQLAAVVFVQGCSWRCGYCHNPHLQKRIRHGNVEWGRVKDMLTRRMGLLDGVVFSGGEPTTDPALREAIGEIRALGFKTGLHTAGTHPARLKEILPLLDWVGLDVKAPFESYSRITQIKNSGDQALNSLTAVLAGGVNYECRTTLHPVLLPEIEILNLARELMQRDVKNYVLQIFRALGCNDPRLNAASTVGYPSDSLVEQLKGMFPRFTLRRG